MANMRFILVATVRTANPKAIRSILEKIVGDFGSFKEVSSEDASRKGKSEFLVEAIFEGLNAKELNRSLLSTLRKAEKRTSINAEWSLDDTTERYFDYILKKQLKNKVHSKSQ